MAQRHIPVFSMGAAALLALSMATAATPAAAQALGAPITRTLASASDAALDQLAKPGAFYQDDAIRILLPRALGKASGLLKLTDSVGLTTQLTRTLNDAAGLAASEAKPIFRNAINQMTIKDGVEVATHSDGATRYLEKTSGTELHGKIRPLIVDALGKTGAYDQLAKISAGGSLGALAGLNRDSLTDSVTDQALAGIFKYIGAEEGKLRANPLETGKKLLQGLR